MYLTSLLLLSWHKLVEFLAVFFAALFLHTRTHTVRISADSSISDQHILANFSTQEDHISSLQIWDEKRKRFGVYGRSLLPVFPACFSLWCKHQDQNHSLSIWDRFLHFWRHRCCSLGLLHADLYVVESVSEGHIALIFRVEATVSCDVMHVVLQVLTVVLEEVVACIFWVEVDVVCGSVDVIPCRLICGNQWFWQKFRFHL